MALAISQPKRSQLRVDLFLENFISHLDSICLVSSFCISIGTAITLQTMTGTGLGISFFRNWKTSITVNPASS